MLLIFPLGEIPDVREDPFERTRADHSPDEAIDKICGLSDGELQVLLVVVCLYSVSLID